MENMATAFTRWGSDLEQVSAVQLHKLHAKIGQLVVERDFDAASQQLLGTRGKNGSKGHELRGRQQCVLLTLSRSNIYYEPEGESADKLQFM